MFLAALPILVGFFFIKKWRNVVNKSKSITDPDLLLKIKENLQARRQIFISSTHKVLLLGIADYIKFLLQFPIWSHLKSEAEQLRQEEESKYKTRVNPGLAVAWEKVFIVYDTVHGGISGNKLGGESGYLGLRDYIKEAVTLTDPILSFQRKEEMIEAFERVHNFVLDEGLLLLNRLNEKDILAQKEPSLGWLDRRLGEYQFGGVSFKQTGKVRGLVFRHLMDLHEQSPHGISIKSLSERTKLTHSRLRIEIAAIRGRLKNKTGYYFKGSKEGYYTLEH